MGNDLQMKKDMGRGKKYEWREERDQGVGRKKGNEGLRKGQRKMDETLEGKKS